METSEIRNVQFKKVIAPFAKDVNIVLRQVIDDDTIHREIVEVNDTEDYRIVIDDKVKTLLQHGYVKQRTEKWLQSRQRVITASKVDSVIKPDANKTKEAMFRTEVGLAPKFKGNKYTEHGMRYEPIAIHRYMMFTRKMGLKFGLIMHNDIPFIGGSPDLITLDGVLVEIKCPYRRKESRINNLKRCVILPQYMSQVQLLLEITELETAHYVEYYLADKENPEELYMVEIKRNRQWFQQYLPRMRNWHERLSNFYVEKMESLQRAAAYKILYARTGKLQYLMCAFFFTIKYRKLMHRLNGKSRRKTDAELMRRSNSTPVLYYYPCGRDIDTFTEEQLKGLPISQGIYIPTYNTQIDIKSSVTNKKSDCLDWRKASEEQSNSRVSEEQAVERSTSLPSVEQTE